MIIYFLTITILFAFSLLVENYKLSLGVKKWMIFISYILLVLQVGFRWETGTDWIPYYNHFDSFTGITSLIISDYEYGYGVFVWLIKSISSNYSTLLFIHASIYYFLIFNSVFFFYLSSGERNISYKESFHIYTDGKNDYHKHK